MHLSNTVVLGISVFLSLNVCAEYRVWEGQGGSVVEAEFVSMKAGMVQLKKRDGKVIKVPVSKLSKVDQDYIAVSAPPKLKIEIEVNTKNNGELRCFPGKNNHGQFDIPMKDTTCLTRIAKRGTSERGSYIIKQLCVGQNTITGDLTVVDVQTLHIPELLDVKGTMELESPTLRLAGYRGEERFFNSRTDEVPVRLLGCITVVYNGYEIEALFEESAIGLRNRFETELGALETLTALQQTLDKKYEPAAKTSGWMVRYMDYHNRSWSDGERFGSALRPLSLFNQGDVVAFQTQHAPVSIRYPHILRDGARFTGELEVLSGQVSLSLLHDDDSPGEIYYRFNVGERYRFELQNQSGKYQFLVDGKPHEFLLGREPLRKGADVVFSFTGMGGIVRFHAFDFESGP